ncbi:MAG: hypothetical protein H6668_02390 [Ardenticatenaceae bacterium]|nr:hypothetical protein [Ardenticatenaceae bacterium]
MSQKRVVQLRAASIVVLLVIGLAFSGLALAAELLGLDITPGFGMVQMFQLLIGITCLTLAAYLYLNSLRPKDTARSLQADIGVRLAATGLVFAYVCGLSDLMGIGTHIEPGFERPFVGPLQLGGLLLGGITITIGLLLYHTSRGIRENSSMEFIIQKDR